MIVQRGCQIRLGPTACAHHRALIAAGKLADDGALARMKAARYHGWENPSWDETADRETLASLAQRVESGEIDPHPQSGQQELYENVVNAALWSLSPRGDRLPCPPFGRPGRDSPVAVGASP